MLVSIQSLSMKEEIFSKAIWQSIFFMDLRHRVQSSQWMHNRTQQQLELSDIPMTAQVCGGTRGIQTMAARSFSGGACGC